MRDEAFWRFLRFSLVCALMITLFCVFLHKQAYDTSNYLTYKGTPMQKTFAYGKLNPKVNEAKLAVAAYDRLVAQYRRTGTGEAELVAAQKNLELLLQDITRLIQECYNSDLPSK